MNTKQLRAHLINEMLDLADKKITSSRANATARLASAIIASVRVEQEVAIGVAICPPIEL